MPQRSSRVFLKTAGTKKNKDMKNMAEFTNQSIANDASKIKSKVSSGEYKISAKNGRSKVWNTFASIRTDGGEEVPGFLICRKCLNIYKHNKRTTSNLVKHKCYIVDEIKPNVSAPKMATDIAEEIKPNVLAPEMATDIATKNVAVDVFTKWVVTNCRPFQIANDPGLKEVGEFFVSIGAKFGRNIDVSAFIPDPTTISRNIDSMYETHFHKIKTEISTIVDIGFGLTCNLWTDNYLRKSYLSLTIHFVKEGNLQCRLLGLKSMDKEKSTGQEIHAKVINLLSEFGCALSNKSIMVTDRNPNMVSSFRTYNHLSCINHLLQNTIKKSINDVDEISNMCTISSNIVNYFKNSENDYTLKTSLKSVLPTRWNTFYYLLESIKSNWNEITQILQEKNELERLGKLNISQLNCVIEVLQLFEEPLKKLESEKYPTLHLVIIHIDKLIRNCAIRDSDISIIKTLKKKILFHIKAVVRENLSDLHKIALFLFPPANRLFQFNDDEKEAIKEATRKIMSEFPESSQPNTAASAEISQSNSELFGRFVFQKNPTGSTENVSEEVTMYENTKTIFYDNFDVLKWWDTHKNEYPLLYKTSCRVFSIPASSAASERIFSDARSLLTEKRGLKVSNSKIVNQIIFLNKNCTL